MRTEAEIRELVQRLYVQTGGNRRDVLRVTPRFGGWYTALKYEVIRADNSRTSVWRKDIEEANHAAIIDALKTFSR